LRIRARRRRGMKKRRHGSARPGVKWHRSRPDVSRARRCVPPRVLPAAHARMFLFSSDILALRRPHGIRIAEQMRQRRELADARCRHDTRLSHAPKPAAVGQRDRSAHAPHGARTESGAHAGQRVRTIYLAPRRANYERSPGRTSGHRFGLEWTRKASRAPSEHTRLVR